MMKIHNQSFFLAVLRARDRCATVKLHGTSWDSCLDLTNDISVKKPGNRLGMGVDCYWYITYITN